MERYVDLHTHTTASDGSMTPAELVRLAKAEGLSGIAVTDHDTVEGIGEAAREAHNCGLDFIAGVEISVNFDPELHILGYFPENGFSGIEETLNRLRRHREERNPKIVAKLAEMGFDICMADVEKAAEGSIIGRPHIAKVLMEKGYVRNVQEAFERYLASGRPAYFKKDKLTPEEGIREILNAGGVPVLAHPVLYFDIRRTDELLSILVPAGLRGIEAYYVDNTGKDTGGLLRLAIKYKIIPTGGSDFHGNFKPDIRIGSGRGGLKVPRKAFDDLLQALRKPM